MLTRLTSNGPVRQCTLHTHWPSPVSRVPSTRRYRSSLCRILVDRHRHRQPPSMPVAIASSVPNVAPCLALNSFEDKYLTRADSPGLQLARSPVRIRRADSGCSILSPIGELCVFEPFRPLLIFFAPFSAIFTFSVTLCTSLCISSH